MPAPTRCPCLSGLPFTECCGPLHSGTGIAPTAERLMRSRYSAFAVGDVAYLLATWHPSTRPKALELDDRRWFRLDIVAVSKGTEHDAEGVVEFAAHYRSPEGAGIQHGMSRFARVGARWFYLDEMP